MDLGTVTILALVLVIPKYLISYAVAVPFAKKMYVPVPENAVMAPEKKEGTAGGPSFGLVISIVLLPILLILISASAGMMTAEGAGMQRFLDFLRIYRPAVSGIDHRQCGRNHLSVCA